MKRYGARYVIIGILLCGVLVGTAGAISVTPSPSAPTVGQQVTFATQWSFPTGNSCNVLNIGYGDGYTGTGTPTFCVNEPVFGGTLSAVIYRTRCSYNFVHTYNRPSNPIRPYQVTASTPTTCAVQPDPVNLSLRVVCPPVTFVSPAKLPAATYNQPYSYQLQLAPGTVLPNTWTLVKGSLPPGLFLGRKGDIYGTPTMPGNYSFVIQAADACPTYGNSATQEFFLSVNCPALTFLTTSLPDTQPGQKYYAKLQAAGGVPPYIFGTGTSGANLPPGISVASNGTVSGVANVTGTYNFSLTVSDGCPSPRLVFSSPLTIRVAAPCPPLSLATTAVPAATAGQMYSYQLQAAGGQVPYTWSTWGQSLEPPGMVLSPSGVLSGVPTTPGTYQMNVAITDSCSQPQSIERSVSVNVNVGCPPVVFSPPASLPGSVVGSSYSYQLNASGGYSIPMNTGSFGTVSFSVVSGALPPGMTLSPSGLISGTSRSAGTFSFTVRASDACPTGAGAVDRTMSIVVGPAVGPCAPLGFTSSSTLAAGIVGQGYMQQILVSGGEIPVRFQLVSGTLPPGTSISPTGAISGVPTTAGDYRFTVQATDTCAAGAQTANRTFTVKIAAYCAPLNVESGSELPGAATGQAYSNQILTIGGQAPLVFDLVSGSLPPGMSLSSTGLISGTATEPGTYSFKVRTVDSCSSGSQSRETTFSITVTTPPPGCAALSITTGGTLPAAQQGIPYGTQFQASGGTGSLSWGVTGGRLPSGLSLNPGGALSGTPTELGTHTVTVAVTDSCPAEHQTVEKVFLLRVDGRTVNVSVAPGSLSIARRSANVAAVTYVARGDSSLNGIIQSPSGQFFAGGELLGETGTPLAINLVAGSGVAAETLSIPVAVARRAEELGQTTIVFQRTFSDATGRAAREGGISATARLDLRLTTPALAQLTITRMQLSFADGTPKATVKRNDRNLRAFLDVGFQGFGLFQGYWQVDKRILSQVNQHFVYGQTVRLETPAQPPLPTFDEGSHILQFVVVKPENTIPFPEAIYFVTGDEAEGTVPTLQLASPQDRAEVTYGPIGFSWDGLPGASAYRVEIFGEIAGPALASAYVRETTYTVPESVVKKTLVADKEYYWRVRALDGEGKEIGVSQTWRLSFDAATPAATFVPGRILVVTSAEDDGRQLARNIGEKFGLAIVEEFELKSLGFLATVFSADGDIFEIIPRIAREQGIILVQPDHIFRTLGEPLEDLQNLDRTLKLSRLREHVQGKGVTVAVVDTGVDLEHRDLVDRITTHENFVKGDLYLGEIHGTAVAGVICASLNGYGIGGIAPQSRIAALRACRQLNGDRPVGECSSTSVARAIDRAIELKAKVVNMSYGSPAVDDLVARLLEKGADEGVLFVAPVGNNPSQKVPAFPASHPSVIAVAGLDISGNPLPNKEIAAKARVVVPAEGIFTTVPGNKHNFVGGTSIASATVSGMLALAAERDATLIAGNVPTAQENFCAWEESLLKMPICGDAN